jgi:hypothetical protein
VEGEPEIKQLKKDLIGVATMRRDLLSRFTAFRFAARRSLAFDLSEVAVLPLFNRRAAEPPGAADAKAGNSPLAQQSVDCRRMDSKVL